MIFQKILIVLIFLLTAAYPVYAEPMISSVSGAGNHGNSITIIGSGFGTKSPAAPLLWDDCEDKTVNSTSAVSSEGG